ncbi:phospho-N-acetylmuramoyl-pentapeptide-transferase [Candidatus Dependentiae bacterium Noda2021]|nr:phospho-N-acetylmuramoyl-pentapeptide-transferase [Candidatus Dependentiae bacterium Noda2021]
MYHISTFFTQWCPTINALHYVSFRTIAGLLTTLFLFLCTGSWFIAKSRQFFRSKARENTPESHRQKDDMPTMGGVLILATTLISSLIWCDIANPLVWIFLVCLFGFGAIGFWDDWCKINKTKGISARYKFIAQWSVALLIVSAWVFIAGAKTTVTIPFFKNFNPDLGLLFIPWAAFILVSCSNAVNLTDGLDGLAIGSLIPNFATFSVIAYLAGHCALADYLFIPFASTAEIAVMGAIMVGASLGFLWFNAYPAQIFMGDVGSLALGRVLRLWH